MKVMTFGHVQEHTRNPCGTVCVCVSECVRIGLRQKDKEGEFNGVSQGEAPLFPLIKHAGSALAP